MALVANGNFLDLDLMRLDITDVVCKICSCVIRAIDGQTTNLHAHFMRLAEVNRNDDKQNITEHRAGL